jgi:hypothetical protein
MKSPLVTFLSLARKMASWQPAPGQAQPQYPLPKKRELINIRIKIIKLPLIMPFELA